MSMSSSGAGSGLTPGTPLELQATTGTGGYTLVNGTGTILSFVPQDGNMHRAFIAGKLVVTSAETGGAIGVIVGGVTIAEIPASQAAGTFLFPTCDVLLRPGESVTIQQTSALTGGAAIFYGEIWGS